MKKINAIFISFDDNFLSYANCCLNSILANYPDYPCLIIDYQGGDKRMRAKLDNMVRVELIKIDNKYDFNLGPVGNNIVFNRYSLWSGRFSNYKSILHLDADTIVLGSLDELFANRGFFAVEDARDNSDVFLHRDRFLKKKDELYSISDFESLVFKDNLNLDDPERGMLNAGVFMLPEDFRSEKAFKNILDIASRYNPYIAYADQSVISIWCWLSNIEISREFSFNCQVRFLCEKKYFEDFESIKILHFSGEAKFYDRISLSDRDLKIFKLCDKLRLFYRKERDYKASCSEIKMFKKALLDEKNQ